MRCFFRRPQAEVAGGETELHLITDLAPSGGELIGRYGGNFPFVYRNDFLSVRINVTQVAREPSARMSFAMSADAGTRNVSPAL